MRWIEALFGKFAVIWPQHWSGVVNRVGDVELLKAEWAEGLDGLGGEQIKHGISHVRAHCEWPPSIAEFRKACLGGATPEQLAFAARAQSDRPALPSRTWAESRADGAARAQEARQAARPPRVLRTEASIAAGLWTREMEADYARHAAFLGLALKPVAWPDGSAA